MVGETIFSASLLLNYWKLTFLKWFGVHLNSLVQDTKKYIRIRGGISLVFVWCIVGVFILNGFFTVPSFHEQICSHAPLHEMSLYLGISPVRTLPAEKSHEPIWWLTHPSLTKTPADSFYLPPTACFPAPAVTDTTNLTTLLISSLWFTEYWLIPNWWGPHLPDATCAKRTHECISSTNAMERCGQEQLCILLY